MNASASMDSRPSWAACGAEPDGQRDITIVSGPGDRYRPGRRRPSPRSAICSDYECTTFDAHGDIRIRGGWAIEDRGGVGLHAGVPLQLDGLQLQTPLTPEIEPSRYPGNPLVCIWTPPFMQQYMY